MDNIASLIENVPMSVLPYPEKSWDQAKYAFWRAITPAFLNIRDALLRYGVIHHKGRQEYILGKLNSLERLQSFLIFLQAQGFGNHFIAWKDEGQLISLRRLEGFGRQYHLRIFKDGEIRGHYEFTPEAHPFWHFKETGIEQRRTEFLNFLGDWIS